MLEQIMNNTLEFVKKFQSALRAGVTASIVVHGAWEWLPALQPGIAAFTGHGCRRGRRLNPNAEMSAPRSIKGVTSAMRSDEVAPGSCRLGIRAVGLTTLLPLRPVDAMHLTSVMFLARTDPRTQAPWCGCDQETRALSSR